MKSALLVIDVQQALCTGKYAMFDAAGVIGRINSIAERARAANVPVIYIQHESDDGVLNYGSDGWKLAEGLEARPLDTHVRKTATDSFHKTELQSILQAKGIDHLVICGMQSDFCVDTTTRRALGLGYPVTLVSDGHTTMDNEVLSAEQISRHHTVTLANIDSFGVRATALPAAEVRFGA